MSLDIIIVDDEADIRELISDVLTDEDYTTRTAKNSDELFGELAKKLPNAIILDIWLKDSQLDGLGILETVQRKYTTIPIIIISGHGNIETAITSLKMGAYDYLEKPFKEERLLHTLTRAIETAKLQQENSELKLRVNTPNLLVGNSPAITQLRQTIDKVAPTGSRVFIIGPASGGKEAIAELIHEKSHRKEKPFVALNAATLSSDMIDYELFGTEESHDINAPARKIGLLEQANHGTLFINEISEIPLATQGKIVRFLQTKRFQRIGSNVDVEVDIRVIASSQKNIQQEIDQGRLREDLYYRLNVVPVELPELKDRREDIPLLCDYFMTQAATSGRTTKRELTDDALAALQAYHWPGNIRQLCNIIEWLLIMYPEDHQKAINSDMLPREIFSATPATITPEINTDIMSMKLRPAREVFERQYLLAQIERFGGNISRTASFIGMERSALHRKLKLLNVQNGDDDLMNISESANADAG